MKLPKSFISKKVLDQLKEPEEQTCNPKTVEYLLETCEEFLETYDKFLQKQTDSDYKAAYSIGEELAKEIKYAKLDVEELSQKIKEETLNYSWQPRIESKNKERRYLGIYISALINKVIKEDDIITLKLNLELEAIGMRLKRGTLITQGNVGNYLGSEMEGGEIVAEGRVKDFIGLSMKGGKITLKGEIQAHYIGLCMTGGEITKKGQKNI